MSPVYAARLAIEYAHGLIARSAGALADDALTVEVMQKLDEALIELKTIRLACLQCGGENARRGDYCSDRCRAEHYRSRMPAGVVKSVRRLTNDRASIVVHYLPDEADRAIGVVVGETVHLAQEPRS